MSRYKHRDPKPTTRDPMPDDAGYAPSTPPAQPPAPPPPLPNALLMQVELPKCKRCGGTKFHKCNATRPNLSATQMTRRKQCYQCGQWWVMQSDPTPEERARYWKR